MQNINLHPGRLLKDAFLQPLGISVYRLSKEINVPQTRLSQIIAGKRSISCDTALRLSKFFGLEESFWLEAQLNFDLNNEKAKLANELDKIKPFTN